MVTVTSETSLTLAQLTGTYFGAGIGVATPVTTAAARSGSETGPAYAFDTCTNQGGSVSPVCEFQIGRAVDGQLMRGGQLEPPYRNLVPPSLRVHIVDEMQDYTSVQYAVIARLFLCKKTILGDANQSVNPYGSSTTEDIQRVFRQASSVKLCKSYRSTYEITQFAQRISPNPDLVAIERHGEEPQVLRCRNKADEIEQVCRMAREFVGSDLNTLGVICKTQKQAERLHEAMAASGLDAHLLTAQSTSFTCGVIVCTARTWRKGSNSIRSSCRTRATGTITLPWIGTLLYVACTRAMHKLTLTFSGNVSGFVQQKLA
jgi:hypothetical protein